MAANPWLKFPAIITIFFISFSLKAHFCHGADRITQNQSLSAHQTLISSGSRFELGFFKPGNSSNYYLGIWFHKVSRAVWVANRESPIFNPSSTVLRFSDGNLALFSNESGQVPIWSTNSSTPCTEAVLQDNGNLVLKGGSSDDEILWQSFEHPSDTLLPGAKLGHNKITGRYITMVPWKSEDDPAPGDFTVQLDPNGTNQLVVITNKSTLHWTSGLWNGRFFSSVPEMMWKNIYDFVYIDNENEAYYAYSVLNKSLIFRKSVSKDGNFQVLLWNQNWNLIWSQPRSQCEVRQYCGAFGSCHDGSSPSCYCVEGFVPKSADEYSSNVFYNGSTVAPAVHMLTKTIHARFGRKKFTISIALLMTLPEYQFM